jgi:hypothetical protein
MLPLDGFCSTLNACHTGKFYNQQQQYLLNQKRVEAKEFKKKAQGLKLSMKSIDNALTLLSDRTFKDPTPYKVVNKKKPSLIAFTPNAVFPAFRIIFYLIL